MCTDAVRRPLITVWRRARDAAAGARLEREPLSRLAAEGRLRAYRHTGLWACMDTHKDAAALEDLWAAGRAPWRVWP